MIYHACAYTCIAYIFIDKHTHIYVYVCIFNFIPGRICGDCIYEYRTSIGASIMTNLWYVPLVL